MSWRQMAENVLVLIIVLSVFLNLLVVVAFIKSRRLMQQKDLIIVSLAVCDLLQAVIGYPSEVKEMFDAEDQTIKASACKLIGFVVSSMAYVSIAHLTWLTCDRAVALRFAYKYTEMFSKSRVTICLIVSFWVYGIFWAVLPLVGWSSYELEQDGYRCSINWTDRSLSNRAYVCALFVFCFFLPIALILVAVWIIQKEMRQMRIHAEETFGANNAASVSTLSAEHKAKKMVLTMVTCYCLAWTPYAIVSLLITADVSTLPDGLVLTSALLAKTSCFYNPIIYAFLYGAFRNAVQNLGKNWKTSIGTVSDVNQTVS